MFNSKFYKDTDNLDEDSAKALLLSRQRLKQECINRAKTITAAPEIDSKIKRNGIPENVKMIVWQRDEDDVKNAEHKLNYNLTTLFPLPWEALAHRKICKFFVVNAIAIKVNQ